MDFLIRLFLFRPIKEGNTMAANFLKSLFGEEDIDEQDGLYETSEQVSTPANTSNKVVSINSGRLNPVSYTHLTLPTILLV